jgi:hypothetical protein
MSVNGQQAGRTQPGTSPVPTHLTVEALRDQHVQIINKTAVILGLVVFGLMLTGAFFWRLAAKSQTLKKLAEFEFMVEEPNPEQFKIQKPMRDILREQLDRFEEKIEVEEKPDIHMTTVPTEVEVLEEVIQTPNIEIETPEIEPTATEIDIDAPEQITEVADQVEFAVDPIAANLPQPADIFQYDKPNPPNKPQTYTYNRAPKASRVLKVLPKQFGDQEAPSMGELGPLNINLFGDGMFFRAMTHSGGLHARSAVDAALHWLAVHQEADGSWKPENHDGKPDYDVGCSGLSLLAFMGAGQTTRRGEWRRAIMRGFEWLLSQQKQDGQLGSTLYEHSIATIALCEIYGRARDERMALAARKAVAWLERAQLQDGGWRYHPTSKESDVSVTGWAIQALKAAKLAQVKFDESIYARALLFIDALTDKNGAAGSSGAVGYQFQKDQAYAFARPAMTAAGMVVRQFSGLGVDSDLLRKGAELLKTREPSWSNKDFYLWYYATYAMHNMSGAYRIWWFPRIRDVLIDNQSREGDDAGSWEPDGDAFANRTGGRVYTTALGALCLEVYYRYSAALNSFGVAPDIDDLFLQ